MITVTVFHNVARDGQGRPTGMLDGYQPGDPIVRVFTYQADPVGRDPEQIAEEAFAICNGHPCDADGEELARRYYGRELRSLSFPGKRLYCPTSCCACSRVVLCDRRERGWPGQRWSFGEHSASAGTRGSGGQPCCRAGAAVCRPMKDAAGRVRGIGGLLTVRDDQGRAVPALDGQLDKDSRRVLLRIEPSGWERERYGDAGATARKLRTLAATLIRHADTIDGRGLA